MINKILNKFGISKTAERNPKYGMMLEKIGKYIGSLEGKRVLDAGTDISGVLVSEIQEKFQPAEIIGINPMAKEDVRKLPSGAMIMKQSANKVLFDDGYFDCIVSLAAFEHFPDLPGALEELYRVLKPGGMLVTVFGPIWSAYNGHHLWTYVRGEEVSYRNTFLPPFCHLIMEREGLYQACMSRYDAAKTDVIVKYVYECPDQNRLFFNDYEKIFHSCKLKKIIFAGLSTVPFPESYGCSDYRQIFEQLKSQYPDKAGFEYGTIEAVLTK